jgi:hypothetical protein
MELKPFLLDVWLDTYEHGIECNLAASTGPSWTLNEILSLASDEERQIFLKSDIWRERSSTADRERKLGIAHGIRGACVSRRTLQSAWNLASSRVPGRLTRLSQQCPK